MHRWNGSLAKLEIMLIMGNENKLRRRVHSEFVEDGFELSLIISNEIITVIENEKCAGILKKRKRCFFVMLAESHLLLEFRYFGLHFFEIFNYYISNLPSFFQMSSDFLSHSGLA